MLVPAENSTRPSSLGSWPLLWAESPAFSLLSLHHPLTHGSQSVWPRGALGPRGAVPGRGPAPCGWEPSRQAKTPQQLDLAQCAHLVPSQYFSNRPKQQPQVQPHKMLLQV